MEDAHIIADGFGDVATQGLFAVFDGHGGRGVVDYLYKCFEKNFLAELLHEQDKRPVSEAFTSAYLITDIETSKEGLTISGSTAVTCLLRVEDGSKVLYTANVGDSRAVLCRGDGTAERLTYDHKASDESEMKRIEDAGGFILRKRVLGILSVSRSFGDHAMKKFVLARPYTSRVLVGENDPFVIIACDGVWDVLSDQEAVEFIKKAVSDGANMDDLSKMLVQEALNRGSTDNVTALVVHF
uniref:PPM-type phosphatase domain-containing protein n=1 Tax=Mucochytrium quahogii TaxID=96639 RepID=A0A7S2WAS5_9STRA